MRRSLGGLARIREALSSPGSGDRLGERLSGSPTGDLPEGRSLLGEECRLYRGDKCRLGDDPYRLGEPAYRL